MTPPGRTRLRGLGMKRWLLTLLVLLAGMADTVRANYFLIVINTGATPAPGDMTMTMGMGMQPATINPADLVTVIVQSDNVFSFTEKLRLDAGAPLQAKYHNYT